MVSVVPYYGLGQNHAREERTGRLQRLSSWRDRGAVILGDFNCRSYQQPLLTQRMCGTIRLALDYLGAALKSH